MPAISLCPRCQKPVSLPAGIDPAAPVRCPQCMAEYPLGEAIPPELVPVGVAASQEAIPASDEIAEPVEAAAADALTVEQAAAVEAGPEVALEENGPTQVAGRISLAAIVAARGPRRPPKSPLRVLIGCVVSGLAGCLVAYYALAIYYGPDFKKHGFPQLPLPFVAKLTAPPAKAEDAGATPAAEQPTDPDAANRPLLPNAFDAKPVPPKGSSEPASSPSNKSPSK